MALWPAGSVCLPCDEGRNGVWAAEQGWDVHTFDLSKEVGVSKTQQLAQTRGVALSVQVADMHGGGMTARLTWCVRAHAPRVASAFHRTGVVLGEARRPSRGGGFHRDQLGLNSGGPKMREMLFHEATFVEDLVEVEADARLVWNARCEQVLDEGPFHQGPAVTCQVVLPKHA